MKRLGARAVARFAAADFLVRSPLAPNTSEPAGLEAHARTSAGRSGACAGLLFGPGNLLGKRGQVLENRSPIAQWTRNRRQQADVTDVRVAPPNDKGPDGPQARRERVTVAWAHDRVFSSGGKECRRRAGGDQVDRLG